MPCLRHRWQQTRRRSGAVVGSCEANETQILNALPLTGRHRINDDIGQIAAVVGVQPGAWVVQRASRNDLDLRGNGFAARVIEDDTIVRCPNSRAKSDGRDTLRRARSEYVVSEALPAKLAAHGGSTVGCSDQQP